MRVIPTRHYLIHTDLDDNLATDLAQRMDAMYDQYAQRLSTFGPIDNSQPLEAFIFRRQAEYIHLAGITAKATSGIFLPQHQIIATYLQYQGRDAIRRVLQHEAFHQFADRVISHHLPTWLNEGLAQVFEEGIWTGHEFLLGQVPPYRLRQLNSDIASPGLMDFRTILQIQPQQWASHWDYAPAAALEYNQAWAMTHFLIFATDDSGQPRYRSRLIRMLQFLHDGMDADQAFRWSFSDNYQGFRDRFMEYVQTLRPTPLAQAIEDQGVLADIEVALTNRGVAFDSLDDLHSLCVDHRFQMRYRRGNITWESDSDPDAYFAAPNLHFEPSETGPIPDLVSSAQDGLELRTRFYQSDSGIEHETIVEDGQ